MLLSSLYSIFQGLPPGVVNIVFGVGPKCGAALVKHPDVPIISFTGSTATGRYIIENSAPYFKKLSLEVGSVYRGYYRVAQRYQYYFRVMKTILFSTRENNVHIFKLPCNVLFIIWSEVGTSQQRTYKSRGKTHALHIFSYLH